MRVTVVGAGVVGLACAWELAEQGAEVTVLDAGAVGDGSSRGNTGWVCPSITSPLPAPGMVKEGLHQLATGGDAFVMRPSLDPAFYRWLWRFARACGTARFEAGTRALLALNNRTMELYDRWRDAGLEFEMRETGLVLAAQTQSGLEPYLATTRLLRRLGYGGQIDELGGAEAAEREPALDGSKIHGALHARADRYVNPEELTAALAGSLRSRGVEVREHAPVRSLREVDADKVVVAAGVHTPRLVRTRMPLVGARGYSVTVDGTGSAPTHALYLAEAKLGLSAFTGGVRVAGVFELGARVARAPEAAGEKLLDAARPYLGGWQPPAQAPQAWAGLRPSTADGLPLIGQLDERTFVAAGHTMVGVTLAPSTASILAPLVLRGERAPELEAFDPRRR